MLKKLVFLLISALILASCRNENKDSATAENKADTLTFRYDSVKVYSKNILRTDSTADTTSAVVSYPAFKNDTLNNYIKRKVFDFIAKEEKATSYQNIVNSFVSGYDSFYRENKDRTQTWWLDIRLHVMYQTSDYISIEYTNADFSGGAHPNYYISYINYNPKTNQPITLDSLIEKGQMPKLVTLAESIFRKDEKITPTQSLEEKYFFEKGKFALPASFYVNKEGLVFLYNPYEIKPYVDGTTKLIIPFNQLKGIAKANTILIKQN